MKILTYVLLALLVFISLMSATGKLRKDPKIVAMMEHVGVKSNQIPLLAYIEILAGVGLLVGLKFHALAVAAATGLTLYFIGAVIAHIRVKDKAADVLPAAFIALISAVTAYLISSQLG